VRYSQLMVVAALPICLFPLRIGTVQPTGRPGALETAAPLCLHPNPAAQAVILHVLVKKGVR
jgi:hypothetical protein